MSEDLWGDIPEASGIITPLEILKEQAKTLETKTRNQLTASINRINKAKTPFTWERPNAILYDLDFHYEFALVAPSLNNYTYSVLEIAHDIVPYPVIVFDWSSQDTISCDDVDSYRRSLAAILQSEKTRSVIAALLRQVKT